MEKQSLRIVWTDPAKNDLQNIYDYLAEISIVITENQIFRLIDRVFDTWQNPTKMVNEG
jgi:plasmid stabilization system protein ParE